MKVNFSQALFNKVKKENFKENEKDLLLKEVCQNALLAPEQNESGDDKYKCYKLALQLQSEQEIVDLTIEDLSLIKKKVIKKQER